MINETFVINNFNFSSVIVNNTVYADDIIKELIHTYTNWDIAFLFLVLIFVLLTFYRGYLDKLPITEDQWQKITDIHFGITVCIGVIISYWCIYNIYLYFTT